MADDPDKIYSNTRLTKPLEGNRLPQLGPDLEEDELAAIGLVTAHWAMLEHYLLYQSLQMAKLRNSEPHEDVFNLSLARRLRAWLTEIRLLPDSPRKSALEKLAGKIANCENRRHQTTHGLWAWDSSNPDKLMAFSTRPRVEFEVSVDRDGLIRLAEEIGEVNFVLAYPNGMDDFWNENIASGGSMRRSFLKSVIKKADK